MTQIRKKFLKIAKSLHPDVFGRDQQEKELATKYFAKMVSPAYQLLNNDRDRGEYFATLKLFAQGLKQKSEGFEVKSEIAQKLFKYPNEPNYFKSVSEVAALQYRNLDKVLEYTADLSELNLIYLMTQETFTQPIASNNYISNDDTMIQAAPPPPRSLRNIQLAEVFISKKQWSDAVKELKEAEKLEPNNAKIHALLGVVYMNQNVMIMAKTSFQKAIKLNPKEPTALKYINQVGGTTSAQATRQPPKKDEKKGGFFGWGK